VYGRDVFKPITPAQWPATTTLTTRRALASQNSNIDENDMKQMSSPDGLKQALGLDPIVAFSLAGAIVFFLISGALAYFNLQSLRDNNLKIVHSHEVIIALDELLSSTQDAETGQRGFLLTNNERYLEPYNSALLVIPPRLSRSHN
jgi:CHASE3 domain-containing protein